MEKNSPFTEENMIHEGLFWKEMLAKYVPQTNYTADEGTTTILDVGCRFPHETYPLLAYFGTVNANHETKEVTFEGAKFIGNDLESTLQLSRAYYYGLDSVEFLPGKGAEVIPSIEGEIDVLVAANTEINFPGIPEALKAAAQKHKKGGLLFTTYHTPSEAQTAAEMLSEHYEIKVHRQNEIKLEYTDRPQNKYLVLGIRK